MAKNPYYSILQECQKHYVMWREDNDKRRTRKNGWNDVTNAYWGQLPSDFPYTSKVVDPRIRTSLTEKNARLLNAKLRGRLVPREGGDVLKARLNNALLDFQWDNANYGGSMLSKYAQCDMDTRLHASKFAHVPWRHEVDSEGNIVFDGNEFIPWDIRESGIDPTSTHIRNAKWFQHAEYAKIEDMERVNDMPYGKKYPGLAMLKEKMQEGQDRRDTNYQDQLRTNKGLTDRVGEDKSYPVVEIVTEFRKDRFITFSPKYNIILRDIPNPYDHRHIPVVQLRYYPLGDDPIGESEVEPVIPLWKAICACLCGYLDNMNIHMRPPLKIVEGEVTIESIVFGPEAQWMMNNPNAVTEFQSNGEAMRYFQTTYSALVAAFNTAMGDMSQGISGIDPFSPDKTATEVKQTVRQQNVRDQSNQMYLAETISDMMMMWLSNNRQFLFLDKKKEQYILRIVGSDMFNYFKRAGLDEEEVSPEAMQAIGDVIMQQQMNGVDVTDDHILTLMDAAKTPKYPVFENPNEKDPTKLRAKPKMTVNDMGDGAELTLIPEDTEGMYDYIADTVSMQAGASNEMIKGQQTALQTLINPVVVQLLAQEGVRPQMKDLLVSNFDSVGLKDSERYFTQIEPNVTGAEVPGQSPQPGIPGTPQPQAGAVGSNGPISPVPQQGIPNPPPPQTQGRINPNMA